MANVNANVTESVIKQIMEGADPRTAIDAALTESTALDEKAGYHKEKRIRGGKATTVNVKNTKRKVHHVLTAAQKKAIKKAHSAQANKKRAKSLKKGSRMGLYKEDINLVAEADEEVAGLGIVCPACGAASLEVFNDPDADETDDTVLVCPECGETFVIVSTSELEDDDADDKDDDKDEAEKAEDEAEKAAEEVPQDESVEVAESCDDENCDDANCDNANCDGANCGDQQACDESEASEDSGLFFEQE